MCIFCHDNPPFGLRSMLCGPCFGSMRRDLATLQFAHAWLGAELVALPAAFKPGTIHGSAGPRAPLSFDKHDMRVEIEAVLGSWARVVGEEMTPPLPGPRDGEVATVAAWLRDRDRLSWISDQPWADEFVRELVDLRQRAHAIAPWSAFRQDLPLPCPACGMLSLAVFGGDEFVRCRMRVCGRMMTPGEYRQEVLAWHERATTRRGVLVG